MAKNPVRSEETAIEPTFFIPEGVEQLYYPDVNEWVNSDPEVDVLDVDLDSQFDTSSDSDTLIVDDRDDTADTVLDIPDTFTIVSQTVRTAPGGMQVIDIVAEVDDVDGDIKYEYRITKT